jgi:hypothetical protein
MLAKTAKLNQHFRRFSRVTIADLNHTIMAALQPPTLSGGINQFKKCEPTLARHWHGSAYMRMWNCQFFQDFVGNQLVAPFLFKMYVTYMF